MQVRKGSNEIAPNGRRSESREAIVAAAERLFLERGFGLVSMDELAEAAKLDPVAFRLAHLKDPRARAVIDAAKFNERLKTKLKTS